MKSETFAEKIRAACLKAALEAYEDAGMQGLCAEGRWEAAMESLRTFDLTMLLNEDQDFSAARLKQKQER